MASVTPAATTPPAIAAASTEAISTPGVMARRAAAGAVGGDSGPPGSITLDSLRKGPPARAPAASVARLGHRAWEAGGRERHGPGGHQPGERLDPVQAG